MAGKIPGNITFDEIYAAQVSPGGYRPKVKIHLQELLPTGRAGNVFRELTHWQQVVVHRTIGGKGRCAITLANVDDRFFNNRSARIFSPQKEAITKGYLNDFYRRVLPYVKENNPERRRSQNRDFQGIRTFTDAELSDYVVYLMNFDGWNGGARTTNAQLGVDLVSLGLIQRVIVDVQGQDGAWYALFTGIVSGIEDRYTPGQWPTIELVCTDYWRLFDLSEIVVQTGPDPIADNLQFSLLGKIAEVGAKSNNLADLPAPKIVHLLMDIVQRTMSWSAYGLWKGGSDFPDGLNAGLSYPSGTFQVEVKGDGQNGGVATTRTVTISESDFFQSDPFWYIPFPDRTDVVPSYEGHNTLRHYARPPNLPGSPATKTDGDEPTDGMPVAQLYSTLLVDKYISRGIQSEIYQLLIKSVLSPWQTNRTVGTTILQRIAQATYYDILVTPNGDVLYQIPKYNNGPGEYAPRAATSAKTAAQVTTTSLQTEGQVYDGTTWPEGEFDYAPSPEGYAQKHHGFNYAITSLGNRGWRLFSNEEGLVTTVRVPAGQELIPGLDILEAKETTGRTDFDATKPLVTRFGLRVFESQKLFIKKLYDRPNRKEILDKLAAALLIQINGRTSGGNQDMKLRPDVDIGKNAFHAERQRLLYGIGITHVVRHGKGGHTTWQLAYGHDITREIVSPFATLNDLASLTEEDATAQPTQVTAPIGGASPVPRDSVTGLPLVAPGATSAGGLTGGITIATPTAAQTADFVVPASTYTNIPGFATLKDQLSRAPSFDLTSTSSSANQGVAGTINGRNIYYNVNPPTALLEAAIKKVRDATGDQNFTMTLDEYALARCIQSESGVTPELIDTVLVAQTEVNVGRSRGGVASMLTYSKFSKTANGFFGDQAGRQASTSKDPSYKAFLVARAVLNGAVQANQVFPGLVNYCTIDAFATQAGVTSGARKTLLGSNGSSGWTSRVAWIGTLPPLDPYKRTIFFQERISADRKNKARIAIDALLKNHKPPL